MNSIYSSGEKVPLHCVDRHPTQPHLVATGGQNGILNIWDMRKEQLPVTLFDVHQSHGEMILFYLFSIQHFRSINVISHKQSNSIAQAMLTILMKLTKVR